MVVTDHSVLQIRFSSDPINELEKNFVNQKGKVIMEGYKLHEDIFFCLCRIWNRVSQMLRADTNSNSFH